MGVGVGLVLPWIAMGVGVGLVMGWIRQFRDFIQPPIEVMRAIPPLAIAPMLLI